MLTLVYSPTYKFTSKDIFDYTDTPITFEAYARQSPEWTKLFLAWEANDYQDVGQALDLVGMAIVSVSQNGQRSPLNGREGAEALRAAIEAAAPGYGDTWIKHLARGHYFYHYRRAEEALGNSSEPSPTSSDGSTQVA